ncbi:hypothetical protein [Aquimarina sp. 2201CG5-10]|uniref:hypothetical protein n=1 Tax=Aquimarina callyspongiae TaxID=3098150 RepID=UPI002AB3A3A3|nr:hypothetical protein [Aquimarina sp. 2201CG5-10]MDY8135918.1 hypothetical protein [Aquimarina sp. 2201CG5-10]
MKTINRLLSVLFVTTFLFSCSSVKVTDSWKDIKTSSIKDKNIMVVSRTDNEMVRIQTEKDLVNNLNSKGYRSVESFVLFPESDPTDVISDDEIQKVKKEIKENDVEVIVMTSLKDCQEYTETTTTGSTYRVSTFPSYHYRGYYRGFYRYYGSVYVQSDPVTTVTSKGRKYILETVVYDLTQPENKQLLSVITTEIDNPETMGTTSKDFSKKITKSISK